MPDVLNEGGLDRTGIDPFEQAHDAIEKAHELVMYTDPKEGRLYFRRALERILSHMCPFCGRTDDHEDHEHRFVAPRTRILDTRTLRG